MRDNDTIGNERITPFHDGCGIFKAGGGPAGDYPAQCQPHRRHRSARQLQFAARLGHQRTFRIRENQVLESCNGARCVSTASEHAGPLQVRLRRFGRLEHDRAVERAELFRVEPAGRALSGNPADSTLSMCVTLSWSLPDKRGFQTRGGAGRQPYGIWLTARLRSMA